MLSPKITPVYTCFKASLLVIGVLLAGLVCLQSARADERVDQASVESLVWRIAWGAMSQGKAEAFLGRDLVTQQFYRVKCEESGLLPDKELAQLPAVAPGIDDDDLGRVSLNYMHISVIGLSAIASASVNGNDGKMQPFAIMCVETSSGWKIAALLAR